MDQPPKKFSIRNIIIAVQLVVIGLLLVTGYSAYQTVIFSTNQLTSQIADKDSQITVLNSELVKYRSQRSTESLTFEYKYDDSRSAKVECTEKICSLIVLHSDNNNCTITFDTSLLTVTSNDCPQE